MASRQSYYGRQSYASQGMSRASRNMRESMAPLVDIVSPLDACVQAADACVDTIGSVSRKLEPGVADMERLKKVFQAQHHYLVLPAPDVQRRRAEYAAAIEKQLDPLLARSGQLLVAEVAHIRKLEGRLAELEGVRRPTVLPKTTLAASTSTPASASALSASARKEGSALDAIDMRDKGLSIAQRRKIGALRNRRQKLVEEQKRLMAALEA